MSGEIEVHVDHVRGIVAIQWPDVQGWYVLDHPPIGPDYEIPHYTVPGGMTKLVDPTEKPAIKPTTVPLSVVPRQREPKRYHPIDEARTAPGGGGS